MLRRRFLISSAGAACALISCSRRGAPAGRTWLRVGVSHNLTMSPFYTAYEFGYFSDAGFDIELTRELPSAQGIPLLAGGKQDVSFVGLSAGLMNAVERGARARIVAGREVLSPECSMHGVVYARRSRFPNGVKSMRQLRHCRIAISSTTPAELFSLSVLLEHEGMTRADIELVTVGAHVRLAVLRAGRVDAAMSADAELLPMLADLDLVRGPSLADVLPHFQYSFIAFGSRLLDGDVRTGARFLKAYFRGAREFLAGKTPKFMEEFAKASGLDPKVVIGGCRDTFEHEGELHMGDLQTRIDWAYRQGYIPQPIDARSMVDTRFLEELARMLHHDRSEAR